MNDPKTNYIHLVCKTATLPPWQAVSETTAFCSGCGKHRPLIDAEGNPAFVWEHDLQPVEN